jgi:glucose dehydrogenase
MAWYYQTSPRDMHDWDSAQTPVLIDGTINGRPRKLVSTAARNGYMLEGKQYVLAAAGDALFAFALY